jgi:hypothetical protein
VPKVDAVPKEVPFDPEAVQTSLMLLSSILESANKYILNDCHATQDAGKKLKGNSSNTGGCFILTRRQCESAVAVEDVAWIQ